VAREQLVHKQQTAQEERQSPATSTWRAEHLALLEQSPATTISLIPGDLPRPLIAGLDLWDMWPAQMSDGRTADFDGTTLWFVLSAPIGPDPDLRHYHARIRLLTEREGQWHDCGHALPDGLNPGSREWAGSSVYDADSGRLTLFFTAAGHRGDMRDSWAQRLFAADAAVTVSGATAILRDWSEPREILVADDVQYLPVLPGIGRPGFIKGFRDPAFFADPMSGEHFLLFTASLKLGPGTCCRHWYRWTASTMSWSVRTLSRTTDAIISFTRPRQRCLRPACPLAPMACMR
jgi:levansucrase